LETGSGAKQSVPLEMIRMVKNVVDIPLIVGGGIKTVKQAQEIVKAGADVVITGTLTEKGLNLKERIGAIVAAVKAK